MEDAQATSQATEEQTPAGEDAPTGPPGFSERGRMRRRVRFLRKARELAYRDLGGLVFDLHRFGRRNDALVLAKLETIGRIDSELRALQDSMSERQPVTVLREAGVAACPRCAAIHGSDDRFCPNCGLAMDLRAERPVAGPPASAPTPASVPAPAPMSAPAPDPTAPAPRPPSTPAPNPTAPAARPPAAPAPDPAGPAKPVAAPVPASRAPRPKDPAPSTGERAGADKPDRQSSVDQPTEIVRPPAQSP